MSFQLVRGQPASETVPDQTVGVVTGDSSQPPQGLEENNGFLRTHWLQGVLKLYSEGINVIWCLKGYFSYSHAVKVPGKNTFKGDGQEMPSEPLWALNFANSETVI